MKNILVILSCLLVIGLVGCAQVDDSVTTTTAGGTTTTTTTTNSSTSSSASTTSSATTTTTEPDWNWTQKVAAAGFHADKGFSGLVYDNKMWVIGGFIEGVGYTSEVWSTPDGQTWSLVTNEAAFGQLIFHSSVVYDNKMWVIAGSYSTGRTNEVWSSTDGALWIKEGKANFTARFGHKSLVFNNKMWVIGGSTAGNTNEVWSSTDGVAWNKETGAANFSPRGGFAAVVKDGKMWVIGGKEDGGGLIVEDVWSSSDGITWSEQGSMSIMVLPSDPTSSEVSRCYHDAVTYEVNGVSRIFVTGGMNTWGGVDPNYLADTRFSADGFHWSSAEVSTAFTKRAYHCSLVFNDKIWVIGGEGTIHDYHDAWYSPK